ncbi:hypothetical protein SUGI_0755010 [Cryptomeria japonica]|nr:hypothetical protein SUGI_0755010 [Cryptomeria japonica]
MLTLDALALKGLCCRKYAFEAAAKVMDLCGGQKAVLKIEAFYKPLLGKKCKLLQLEGNTWESMADFKSIEMSSLHYHSAKIEDLCVDFTLPGFPDYPLKQGERYFVYDMENIFHWL